MSDPDPAGVHAQGANLRRWGAILWPSFFAAGIATMVFFAAVDPDELRAITWAALPLSREGGYTLGFFMFWLCTASSSLFTSLLLRASSRSGRATAKDAA